MTGSYIGVFLLAFLAFATVAIIAGLAFARPEDKTAVRRLDLPYEGSPETPRSAVYQLDPPHLGSALVYVSTVYVHGADVTYVYGALIPEKGDVQFNTSLQYAKVPDTADHGAALSDMGYVLVQGGELS